MNMPKCIFHTDSLLREHRLVVKQVGWGKKAEFSLVDWESHRPASKKRQEAFMAALKERDGESDFGSRK